jgi:anti-anti-sigma factor
MARSAVHPRLEVVLREDADAVQIHLAGDLDRDNAWALTAAVIRSESVSAERLVLDFRGLEFIDAGGLRAIAEAGRRTRRHGRGLELANPSDHLLRLLRLTGLDQSLKVV